MNTIVPSKEQSKHSAADIFIAFEYQWDFFVLSLLSKSIDSTVEVSFELFDDVAIQQGQSSIVLCQDNCLLGLEINHELTKEKKKKVIDLLSTYGLKDFINSYPDELSGGMRQRVALIRTLATNPDILLLDEPFSALDYQSRLAVSDDVYRIIKQEKKSAIIVTHDLAEAISLASKVIVLSERPSKIKKVFDIKLSNRSTPIENRKAKEFSEYYDAIWKEIDFHV